MNAVVQSYVNTMETALTTTVHIPVTALMDGKGNTVKMVNCQTKVKSCDLFVSEDISLVYPVNDIYLLLDVNECKVKDPCIHNGTCINNNGSYVCDCTSGWQGKHCEDGKY